MKVNIYEDLEALSIAAANLFVQVSQEAVYTNERFSVALSGGNTPRRLFELLGQNPWREEVPWENTHVFWGDERCVSWDDNRNNAFQAHQLLLNHVPVPKHQIHPILYENDITSTVDNYEVLLRDYFDELEVCFDLMLLGLGNDGHTASLFPGSPVLKERKRWVSEVSVPGQEFNRVTLTIPLIERSKVTVFMVEGAGKAGVLKAILEGSLDPSNFPAQLIFPLNGNLQWLVDEKAAVILDKGKYL